MKKKLFALSICIMLLSVILCSCEIKSTAESNIYIEYLDSKIEKIIANKQENTITKSFYYITDLHWKKNARHSPQLVEAIKQKTEIKDIVFGGDYIEEAYEKKSDAIKIMSDCVSAFKTDDYVAILGNHDMNTTSSKVYEELSDREAIKVLNKGRVEESYFNIDDEENKIGCIYLNTNCFNNSCPQISWFEQKIMMYSSDWTVLVFMHEYNDYATAGICIRKGKNGILIDKLLDDNKSNIKCKIAGIFSAHTHRDYFDYNSFGCPVISTTCDSIGVYDWCDNLYKREKDTITEQAFDVVQVDTIQRKVFMTRIGAGVDRTYYY